MRRFRSLASVVARQALWGLTLSGDLKPEGWFDLTTPSTTNRPDLLTIAVWVTAIIYTALRVG